MSCAVELDRSALETMRNAEINGLVIATSATDAIDHMRDAIKNLPRRKNRTRTGDYVPHISVGFRPPAEDYEYDDDDGDDDDY
jgi:hypothetical protein